jgi:hypothetical protein
MNTSVSLATLATLVSDRTTGHRHHSLRVIDPATGVELLSSAVNLGAELCARRTSRAVARLWAAGARVEVETARGWQERGVIVGCDQLCYLRIAADRAETAARLARLAPTVAARLAV